MKKRAIITGPTGAVGHALADYLISEGYEVYAICNPNSNRIKELSENVKVILCDLKNISGLSKYITEKCDVFFHLGWSGTTGQARNDAELQLNNINYTLEAVKAAEALGCNTFIGAGSQAECGRVEGKICPETPTFPENGYGIAKLCAGQLSRLLCKQKKIRHVWVRILSVYGPFDGNGSMIMETINSLLREERPKLTEGSQFWDYLYSKDAARALFLLSKKGIDGEIYTLGSGNAIPLKEYILCLKDKINSNLELGFGEIPYSDKQIMYLCADISKLQSDVGFETEYIFEEGIKETIKWCKGIK